MSFPSKQAESFDMSLIFLSGLVFGPSEARAEQRVVGITYWVQILLCPIVFLPRSLLIKIK
jgi:hypothetical protein